ncbi:MAG: hypothetical protein LCH26_00405 [Proteobacteria bacterium]|nr:hypothetical protein [Pseudomonadota bacterium]
MRNNIFCASLVLVLTLNAQAFCSSKVQDELDQPHTNRPPSSTGGFCFGLTLADSEAYERFCDELGKQKPNAAHAESLDALFEALDEDAPLERFCTDENNFSMDARRDPRLLKTLTRHLACEGKRTGLRALGLPDFLWGPLLENKDFLAAIQKKPVSEMTFYGTGPLKALAKLPGVKQLHLVWESPKTFGSSHVERVASFPDLEVLTLSGRIFFDRVSTFATPVSRIFAQYIKESKTLKALEISGFNRIVMGTGCFGFRTLTDRDTAFPEAPRGISNYFMQQEFTHLYEAILQNRSLRFLNLGTSAIHDLDSGVGAQQIAALEAHVSGRRASLMSQIREKASRALTHEDNNKGP